MDQYPLGVPSAVMSRLRTELPKVATSAAAAVIDEVPAYSDMRGPQGVTLDKQVELALKGFLLIISTSDTDEPAPIQPVLDAAFALGRGEYRSGRTMDVLLSAYRIGARASWREWSRVARDSGIDIDLLSTFAELIFAYIDEISASSVAGYSYELEASERSRSRRLEELARKILAGGPAETLVSEAQLADWDPPDELFAVLIEASGIQSIRAQLDTRTLVVPGDLPGLESDDYLLLLCPTIGEVERRRMLIVLEDRGAVIGPARLWHQADLSYRRTVKVLKLKQPTDQPLDSNDFLVDLVINADPESFGDLRDTVLSPLDSLRESTKEKLIETLRAWLLLQGRREEIAATLHIHPQTVRYRMGQIRDLYEDRLNDPEFILAATVALAGEMNPQTSV